MANSKNEGSINEAELLIKLSNGRYRGFEIFCSDYLKIWISYKSEEPISSFTGPTAASVIGQIDQYLDCKQQEKIDPFE